ncbi:hypothetical protein HKX48_007890, partial [Thoreauomyces humboldtii]
MADVADCCKTGYIHTGTPTGTVELLYGVQTYVSRPASTLPASTTSASSPTPITTGASDTSNVKTRAILLLTDVFGMTMPNTRLIADRYAQSGFTVFVPDLFAGKALDFRSMRPYMDTKTSTLSDRILKL